ncbi:unnamed protein product, partial [Prorocentrum cordatum]
DLVKLGKDADDRRARAEPWKGGSGEAAAPAEEGVSGEGSKMETDAGQEEAPKTESKARAPTGGPGSKKAKGESVPQRALDHNTWDLGGTGDCFYRAVGAATAINEKGTSGKERTREDVQRNIVGLAAKLRAESVGLIRKHRLWEAAWVQDPSTNQTLEDGPVPTSWETWVTACARQNRWVDEYAAAALALRLERTIVAFYWHGGKWVKGWTFNPPADTNDPVLERRRRKALSRPPVPVCLRDQHYFTLHLNQGEKDWPKEWAEPPEEEVPSSQLRAGAADGHSDLDDWQGSLAPPGTFAGELVQERRRHRDQRQRADEARSAPTTQPPADSLNPRGSTATDVARVGDVDSDEEAVAWPAPKKYGARQARQQYLARGSTTSWSCPLCAAQGVHWSCDAQLRAGGAPKNPIGGVQRLLYKRRQAHLNKCHPGVDKAPLSLKPATEAVEPKTAEEWRALLQLPVGPIPEAYAATKCRYCEKTWPAHVQGHQLTKSVRAHHVKEHAEQRQQRAQTVRASKAEQRARREAGLEPLPQNVFQQRTQKRLYWRDPAAVAAYRKTLKDRRRAAAAIGATPRKILKRPAAQ